MKTMDAESPGSPLGGQPSTRVLTTCSGGGGEGVGGSTSWVTPLTEDP